MENSIVALKEKELNNKFNENETNYGLIISLFSLERLWIPFIFTTSLRKWDVQTKVRQCMDMMWERILEGKSDKKPDFINLLDTITTRYMEDDSNNIVYNYNFDNYLINALYSNIGYFFDDPSSEAYQIRTSAPMAVLELLSDYIIDNECLKKSDESLQNDFEEGDLIRSELKRIDYDMVIAQQICSDTKRLKEFKELYSSLEIVPINTLQLKQI